MLGYGVIFVNKPISRPPVPLPSYLDYQLPSSRLNMVTKSHPWGQNQTDFQSFTDKVACSTVTIVTRRALSVLRNVTRQQVAFRDAVIRRCVVAVSLCGTVPCLVPTLRPLTMRHSEWSIGDLLEFLTDKNLMVAS